MTHTIKPLPVIYPQLSAQTVVKLQHGADHPYWSITGGALGLDHVMLSGGTTYQGRGYYNEVSGCMKTEPHGVMTDE